MIRQHTLFWGSAYDRGLDILLEMWVKVKEKFPDAELHIAYGWYVFNICNRNDPKKMSWKQHVEKLMEQPGIIHHGRVGQNELKDIRELCGIWSYPTTFRETFCITALEVQASGVVPCVMDIGALRETCKSGTIISGNIYDKAIQEKYLKALFNLMSNEETWKTEQKKGIVFAQKMSWANVAKQWEDEFNKDMSLRGTDIRLPC